MTDAELVEAVAREVLEFNGTLSATGTVFHVFGTEGTFDPFHNDNDWVMVLDNFDEWYIEKSDGQYFCELGADFDNASTSDTLAHAVLEAALKARREECKA